MGCVTKIFNKNDSETDRLNRVANVIGGRVADNINNPDSSTKWVNTYAVRMSYILNYSGLKIKPNSKLTVSGRDKNWYYY